VASGRYALTAIGYKGIEYWSPFICYLGLVTTFTVFGRLELEAGAGML